MVINVLDHCFKLIDHAFLITIATRRTLNCHNIIFCSWKFWKLEYLSLFCHLDFIVMFDSGVCGCFFFLSASKFSSLLSPTRFLAMILNGCAMSSGSAFSNTRTCKTMPCVMVSGHVPCTTARAALLSSRASLERHLESKSWSSRGSFMYPLSNSFVMCFLEET